MALDLSTLTPQQLQQLMQLMQVTTQQGSVQPTAATGTAAQGAAQQPQLMTAEQAMRHFGGYENLPASMQGYYEFPQQIGDGGFSAGGLQTGARYDAQGRVYMPSSGMEGLLAHNGLSGSIVNDANGVPFVPHEISDNQYSLPGGFDNRAYTGLDGVLDSISSMGPVLIPGAVGAFGALGGFSGAGAGAAGSAFPAGSIAGEGAIGGSLGGAGGGFASAADALAAGSVGNASGIGGTFANVGASAFPELTWEQMLQLMEVPEGGLLSGGSLGAGSGVAGAANPLSWEELVRLGQDPLTLGEEAGYGGGVQGGTSGYPGAANPGGGLPNVPGGGNALSRILNGQGTAADWAQIAGSVGSTALGVLGSNAQSDAMRDMQNQYLALGAPSRARLESSYQPGFSIWNEPGARDAATQAADISARSYSASGGNPFGNPNAQSGIYQNVLAGVGLPQLNTYRSQNASSGQLGLNTAGTASAGLAGSSGDLYNSLGFGLSQLTQPQNGLQDLLRQLQGGSNQYRLNLGGLT